MLYNKQLLIKPLCTIHPYFPLRFMLLTHNSYIHTYILIYIHSHTFSHTYSHTYICTFVCMYVHTCLLHVHAGILHVQVEEVNLKPGGDSIEVVESNKREYIK